LSAEETIKKIRIVDPLFQPSGLGKLRVESEEEYGKHVERVLVSLVALPPKTERAPTMNRLNSEIAQAFKKAKVLARGDEGIEDHKVVRNFVIDHREGLIADFALKNGKLLVASTLDLRKSSSGLEFAALSSIKLIKATRVFKEVRTVGVYAVDKGMKANFESQLTMLEENSEQSFDWADLDQKNKFQKLVFDALEVAGDGLFE
jgi:hypothetical protein